MARLGALLLALLKRWWALMGCAIFTVLAYLTARFNLTNDRVVRWIIALAVVSFIMAPILAWWEENSKTTRLEELLNDRQAKFILLPHINLWRYDRAIDKTVFFLLCKLINQGHPSIVTGFSAVYHVGNGREAMISFHLTEPYVLSIGYEVITISSEDLLNNKTSENQVPRGGSVFGRLLFALEGDRTSQIRSAGFRIDIDGFDYLGTKFSATFSPDTKPLQQLIFHEKEKVQKLTPPSVPESTSYTPLPPPEEGE
jgi:hypothetical protein